MTCSLKYSRRLLLAFSALGVLLATGCDTGGHFRDGLSILTDSNGNSSQTAVRHSNRQPHRTSIEQDVDAFQMEASMPAFFSLGPAAVTQDGASTVYHYPLQVSGQSLCGFQLKAVKSDNPKISAFVTATWPLEQGLRWIDEGRRYPAFQDAVAVVQADLPFTQEFALGTSRRCLALDGKNLYHAWDLELLADGEAYHYIVSDQQIFQKSHLSFALTANFHNVYRRFPESGEGSSNHHINDLKSVGVLESSRVKLMEPATSSCQAPYCSVSGDETTFDIEPAADYDQRIADDSLAFINTIRASQYFYDKGFRQFGHDPSESQLALYIHKSVPNPDSPPNVNNARFVPAVGDKPAKIEVGSGDNVVLKNIPQSLSVLFHEYGHWVTFEYLRDIKKASKVVHEAHSDFYAADYTNDPCIAESICVASSGVCVEDPEDPSVTKRLCLRVTNSKRPLSKYDLSDPGLSDEEKLYTHGHSQALSNVLWELRGESTGTPEQMFASRLVYESRKYFASPLTYEGWAMGLLSAALVDMKASQEKLCAMVALLEAREVVTVGSIDCTNFTPIKEQMHPDAVPDPIDPTPDEDTGEADANKQQDAGNTVITTKKEKGSNCGTLAGVAGSAAPSATWLIMVLPLLLASLRQRRI